MVAMFAASILLPGCLSSSAWAANCDRKESNAFSVSYALWATVLEMYGNLAAWSNANLTYLTYFVLHLGGGNDAKKKKMLLEYCDGGALDSVMSELEKGLSERQIAYVCREMTRGLEFLHSRRVIHRDLKAGNVLATMQGGVKLVR
ncbi:hypothetical protein MSG28_009402 [Choristoneura fumiferana]|uniref:Uncharacterized protein n=1 Tax=Choristoneura fumiferana TaxID=7141 RepID=A0ACC0KY01_CHOFU|nr:hypothetical protein MSG28_009402 [Choristoneura fumiferana]